MVTIIIVPFIDSMVQKNKQPHPAAMFKNQNIPTAASQRESQWMCISTRMLVLRATREKHSPRSNLRSLAGLRNFADGGESIKIKFCHQSKGKKHGCGASLTNRGKM